MSENTSKPHARASWRRPITYSTSVAEPPRWPRPVILHSSCGHVLGIGLVWQRQRYVAWKRSARDERSQTRREGREMTGYPIPDVAADRAAAARASRMVVKPWSVFLLAWLAFSAGTHLIRHNWGWFWVMIVAAILEAALIADALREKP